jgi:predicted ABC-type ATPase
MIDAPRSIEYLRDCLMERYERKAELTKLRLPDCDNFSLYEVDSLKEIVVDVYVENSEEYMNNSFYDVSDSCW